MTEEISLLDMKRSFEDFADAMGFAMSSSQKRLAERIETYKHNDKGIGVLINVDYSGIEERVMTHMYFDYGSDDTTARVYVDGKGYMWWPNGQEAERMERLNEQAEKRQYDYKRLYHEHLFQLRNFAPYAPPQTRKQALRGSASVVTIAAHHGAHIHAVGTLRS